MPRKETSIKKKKEKPHSYFEGLKTEWNLFWETILGDDESDDRDSNQTKDPFITGKLEILNLDQIKVITKALSSDRKKLNQRLEALNKEIEENAKKVESLKLVGGEPADIVHRITELTDQGQSISEQLNKINERLRIARLREDQIKKQTRAAEKSL